MQIYSLHGWISKGKQTWKDYMPKIHKNNIIMSTVQVYVCCIYTLYSSETKSGCHTCSGRSGSGSGCSRWIHVPECIQNCFPPLSSFIASSRNSLQVKAGFDRCYSKWNTVSGSCHYLNQLFVAGKSFNSYSSAEMEMAFLCRWLLYKRNCVASGMR